jgi:hypothetical protein
MMVTFWGCLTISISEMSAFFASGSWYILLRSARSSCSVFA